MEIKENDTYSIEDILEHLTCITMTDEIRNEIISSLCIYMRKSVRHNYHEITRYIMKKYSSANESETVYVILDNIDAILDFIKSVWNCTNKKPVAIRDCAVLDRDGGCNEIIKNEGMECYEWKKLYRFVIKLKDHIFLEFIRLSEIRNENARMEEELKKLEDTGKSLEEMENELRKSIDNTTKETKNIYLQMVSILGIFTAIVITVFGGISVVSGIVDGLSMATLEEKKNVIFSITTVITFVIDIVFILLVLIGNMWSNYRAPQLIKRLVIGINIWCILTVLYTIGVIKIPYISHTNV